jgi:predicted DNA-binding transcriptional regulator AlpA
VAQTEYDGDDLVSNAERKRKFVPLSDSAIWQLLQRGEFPRPTWIRGKKFWRASELRAWVEAEQTRPQRRTNRNLRNVDGDSGSTGSVP